MVGREMTGGGVNENFGDFFRRAPAGCCDTNGVPNNVRIVGFHRFCML
jgi:hypothetical protein